MPCTTASERVMGVDSYRSRALPAGTPSRISVITTSPSPESTMRCAVVEPTNPPPTTVTFFRIYKLLGEFDDEQHRYMRDPPFTLFTRDDDAGRIVTFLRINKLLREWE